MINWHYSSSTAALVRISSASSLGSSRSGSGDVGVGEPSHGMKEGKLILCFVDGTIGWQGYSNAGKLTLVVWIRDSQWDN